ncbi:MAG: prepilin-type N-terminal cleavage/methylation domain-containing protein [Nibricoccus sp.]
MKIQRSTKGFTLVEIMIVVVIIGLLAAMAIPAFQKVRRDSIRKTVVNDARILSNAAQQYFMDKAVTTVASSVLVGAAESNYIKALSKGNAVAATSDPLTTSSAYTLSISNPLLGSSALSFDNEGKLYNTGDPY